MIQRLSIAAILLAGFCRASVVVDSAYSSQFQTYTVLTGLDYPVGLARLTDGSLLIGSTTPQAGSGGSGQFAYYLGSGQVLRYAGGVTTVVSSNLPGAVTGVQKLDNNLIVVSTVGNQTSAGFKMADLTFLAGSGNSYTNVGSVHFQYQPGGDAASLEPGVMQIAPGQYKIVFGLEALGNDGTPGGPVTLTGLIAAQLPGGSIDALTVNTSGGVPVVTSAVQLASGIRNTTNPIINQSGTIFFGDNNFDVSGAPVSADELNAIPANVSGIPFYGYPGNYTEYGTGIAVGGQGAQPLVAFQPSINFNSAGIASLALAPSNFPSVFSGGVFVGFHGVYTSGGLQNPSDPVAFVSASGMYTDFLDAGQSGPSHPDSLLATADSLYVVNLFTGNFNAGTGEINVITATPEPSFTWIVRAILLVLPLIKLCAKSGAPFGESTT